MTQEVNSRPLPPASPQAPAAAAPTFMDQVDRGLDSLWHFLSSMRLAMVLMLLIALLAIPGTIFRQIPAGIVMANPQNPDEIASWLDGVRPFYGGWTDILWAGGWGVFNIFNGLLFRILIASLTISLIACSIHRIPGMVRTATRPRVDVGPAFFDHAPQHEAIVARQSLADTQAAVESVLKGRRYRTLAMDDGVVHIYADRFRWLTFSGLIAHLAIVAILFGAILGGTLGYRDPEFAISEGQTKAVVAAPGLAIMLKDFTDSYDPVSGMPTDYVSSVVVMRNGVAESEHQIRVNDPLRIDGLTFYQASFGQSAVMTVKDASGKQLLSEGVPFVWQITASSRPLGIADLPATNQVLWVLGTTGNASDPVQAGQVEVQIFNSGENAPVADQIIDLGKPTTVNGMTISFDRESQYTRLNVSKDPGVPFVWIGSLLLFAGFAIRFMFPHKRLWGRIESRSATTSVVKLASLTSKDVAAGSEFENIATDIRTALQAPANA